MNKLLLLLVVVLQGLLHAGEKDAPLSISLQVGDDLIPIITLKNVSDDVVSVMQANADDTDLHHVFRVQVKPKLKKIGFLDALERESNHLWQAQTLKPGESRSVSMPKLCGLLSVRKAEVEITASYETTEAHRNALAPKTREQFSIVTLSSDPVRMKIDRPPFGVGKIADPEKWANDHKFKGPLLVEVEDHSQQTLRLWMPDIAAGDASASFGFQNIKGLPPTWTQFSADYVVPFLFRNTGIAFVYPWHYESAEQRKKLNEKIDMRSYPWLRPYGLTEELEKKIENHRDFSFTRELDGARIQYRVIDDPEFGALFELWDEEFELAKPEIDQFLKIMRQSLASERRELDKMLERWKK